jgi:hypothetical protein
MVSLLTAGLARSLVSLSTVWLAEVVMVPARVKVCIGGGVGSGGSDEELDELPPPPPPPQAVASKGRAKQAHSRSGAVRIVYSRIQGFWWDSINRQRFLVCNTGLAVEVIPPSAAVGNLYFLTPRKPADWRMRPCPLT